MTTNNIETQQALRTPCPGCTAKTEIIREMEERAEKAEAELAEVKAQYEGSAG